MVTLLALWVREFNFGPNPREQAIHEAHYSPFSNQKFAIRTLEKGIEHNAKLGNVKALWLVIYLLALATETASFLFLGFLVSRG